MAYFEYYLSTRKGDMWEQHVGLITAKNADEARRAALAFVCRKEKHLEEWELTKLNRLRYLWSYLRGGPDFPAAPSGNADA